MKTLADIILIAASNYDLLDDLQRRAVVNYHLCGMMGSKDLVLRWWHSPNRAFNMLCPDDVDIKEVWNYVMGHAYTNGGS